jgi:multisubunit Na+/H+ antiporter MnhF subunit
MSAWMAATIALLPPFALAAFAACRGRIAERLIAVQLATVFAMILLALMSFAFDQSAFIDLPLTLAFLSLPGTLVMAVFLERWL